MADAHFRTVTHLTYIDEALAAGGEPRLALLRFCVMSVTMEPVFVFLAREYQLRPAHAAVLALYDVFCAPDAPVRVYARDLLPPRDLRLLSAAEWSRRQVAQMQATGPSDPGSTVPITAPHRDLFGFVVDRLRGDPGGRFARLSRRYDPRRTPEENLSGGRMSESQRHFRDRIWLPVARPRLVAAGFWQIGTIE
jgi:hypothetical protein